MEVRIALIAFLLLGTLVAQGQQPAQVTQAFERLHPGIKAVQWEVDGPYYVAQFETEGQQPVSCTFDRAGALLEHSEGMAVAALPAPIADAVREQYPGYDVVLASHIRFFAYAYDAASQPVEVLSATSQYVVVINRRSDEIHLIFNESGQVLGDDEEETSGE